MSPDDSLIPINHEHLCSIVQNFPQDYQPYGDVERNGADDCSSGCVWYARLEGVVYHDWGVCTNSESHRCAQLTFEHQGCIHFQRDETLDEPETAAMYERFLAECGPTMEASGGI